MSTNLEGILVFRTGKDSLYWMNRIGELISTYTDHASKLSNPDLWLDDLVVEVWKAVKPRMDLTNQDENIVTAQVMGMLLTLFAARIVRAKSYDARRELKARKHMLETSLTNFQEAIQDCLSDESRDHEYFPAQEWRSPFLEPEKEPS